MTDSAADSKPRRRPKDPGNRTERIAGLKFTPQEAQAIREAAAAEGVSLGTYIATRATAAAGKPFKDHHAEMHAARQLRTVATAITSCRGQLTSLTAERDALIRQLGAAGWSYREIESWAGVSYVTVGEIIKNA